MDKEKKKYLSPLLCGCKDTERVEMGLGTSGVEEGVIGAGRVRTERGSLRARVIVAASSDIYITTSERRRERVGEGGAGREGERGEREGRGEKGKERYTFFSAMIASTFLVRASARPSSVAELLKLLQNKN